MFSSLTVINPNSIGEGGQNYPYDEKVCEKCPCVHNNSTSLLKQISLKLINFNI